jgi:hypothetical protein
VRAGIWGAGANPASVLCEKFHKRRQPEKLGSKRPLDLQDSGWPEFGDREFGQKFFEEFSMSFQWKGDNRT